MCSVLSHRSQQGPHHAAARLHIGPWHLIRGHPVVAHRHSCIWTSATDKDRTMARQDAGDGEGGNPFANATETFVLHLFDRDGDDRGNTT